MVPNETHNLLTLAEELLAVAEHEKERSEEDVVTHLICSNARQSLSNFLSAYLMQQQIEIGYPSSPASLLKQCKSVDARFESLHLAPMHCRFEHHGRDYCLDRDQVDECLQLAQEARAIVLADTPGY